MACESYTELILEMCPTPDEYDRHVPAMLVRTASHNPSSAGRPTNGWEHRSRSPGLITDPVGVSRKVNANEFPRNPKAREKMRDEYSKLTNNGVCDSSGVRSGKDVAFKLRGVSASAC